MNWRVTMTNVITDVSNGKRTKRVEMVECDDDVIDLQECVVCGTWYADKCPHDQRLNKFGIGVEGPKDGGT